MAKTRINLSLDEDLAQYAKGYAADNRTTVADVVTQYLLALKRREDGGRDKGHSEMIFSNPDFVKALDDAQARIRSGKAEWYTFEEVFGK